MAETDTHNSIVLLNADGTGEEYASNLAGSGSSSNNNPAWVQWIENGGLSLDNYSSLEDVLADEKAIRRLMTIHKSVIFLAKINTDLNLVETIVNNDYCAKWINLRDYALDTLYANQVIAEMMDEADKYFYGEWVITDSTTTPATWGPKGNVPVMTSNTAPYGEIVTKGCSLETLPYLAFNGITDSSGSRNYIGIWNGDENFIGYKFVNPVIINAVSWYNDYDASTTKYNTTRAYIKYSDDGIYWVTAADLTITPKGALEQHFYKVTADTPHQYWGFFPISSQNDSVAYGNRFQFYGRELKVSVPKMTSDTEPFGEVIHSSVYQDYYGWYFFNKNNPLPTNTGVDKNGFYSDGASKYCGYNFQKSVNIRKIVFQGSNIAGSPGTGPYTTNYWISYSTDGISWSNLDDDMITLSTLSTYPSELQVIDCNIKAKAVKINNVTTNASYFVYANFYGFDYSEYDWDKDNPRHYIYDHGVEFGEITDTAIVESETIGHIEKRNYDILIVSASSGGPVNCFVSFENIDLTDYEMMFARSGNEYVYNQFEALCVSESDVASEFISYTRPLLPLSCLNVSAINQEKRINVGTARPGGKYTLSEWWLE